MGKKKTQKRSRRLRAKDFGDNPKIRHSHGEHTHFNPNEPWEVRYRREKRRLQRELLGRKSGRSKKKK
jgi:hypothetical protein